MKDSRQLHNKDGQQKGDYMRILGILTFALSFCFQPLAGSAQVPAAVEGTESKTTTQLVPTELCHGGGPNFAFMKGHWSGKSGDTLIHEWWITGVDDETMCLRRCYDDKRGSITLTSITSYGGAPLAHSRKFDCKLNSDKDADVMWTSLGNKDKNEKESAVMLSRASESSEEWRPSVRYDLIENTKAICSYFNKDGSITQITLTKIE